MPYGGFGKSTKTGPGSGDPLTDPMLTGEDPGQQILGLAGPSFGGGGFAGSAPSPISPVEGGGGAATVGGPVDGGAVVGAKPPSLQGLEGIGGGGGAAEGGAPHLMSGPAQTRQGIGQRVPPSMAALLKVMAY